MFGRRIWIEAISKWGGYFYNPIIMIGDNCRFGDNNHIASINKIIIGNGVLTGQRVLIEDHTHGDTRDNSEGGQPYIKPLVSKGPIIIGDDVWIGDNVIICANVKIGNGSIIGANSVVTHDIPPFSVAAGVPVKIIRSINNRFGNCPTA